jgi:RNA polymerase sigma-70 factor (ECF subfamily)
MSIPLDSASTESVCDPAREPAQEPVVADRKMKSGQHDIGASGDCCWSEFAPQATRYAMSIMRSWCDAEEIVQEAFCRLIQSGKLNERRPASPTKTDLDRKATLFATVRNLSIDQLRKQSRRRFEPFFGGQVAASPETTNTQRLEQLETSVQAVMKQMPSEWADALQLKINGELSYQEISIVLGATHGQVRTWIFRARKQLASDLKRQGLLDDEQDDE